MLTDVLLALGDVSDDRRCGGDHEREHEGGEEVRERARYRCHARESSRDTWDVRRLIRVAAIASAVLIAVAAWVLGSPLFIRTTTNEAAPTVAVAISAAATARTPTGSPLAVISPEALTHVLGRGQLQYVDGLHHGTGAVTTLRVLVSGYVRFEDVAITNAPDVHVYLSRDRGGKWSDATSLYLGPLKATDGSFNYDVPAGTDLQSYASVVVWCRAFSVLVTWADLQAV